MSTKFKIFTSLIVVIILFPFSASALSVPQTGNDFAAMVDLNAQAYIVQDVNSGQILLDKNADMQWTPASLTKLVTALVVLDTKPKLSKVIAMSQADGDMGWCKAGGACIKTKPGVTFTVDALFHAALIPSANNAANALARSTRLSAEQFVLSMNKKVQDLGAINTHFNEPTGMDPSNRITAADYAKIVTAAFSNPYLRHIAGIQIYSLKSVNNSKFNQTIKNTDKLLFDSDVQILGAKTGYLTESGYNFSSLLKYQGGHEVAVVVLGEKHLYTAFSETKVLANLAEQFQMLALFNSHSLVLGTGTLAAAH